MSALHTLAGAYREYVELAREYPELARFRRFYERLDNKKDIFYIFFSSGLLMWLRKCLSFIPDSVNVVLIGSALTGEERQWVLDSTHRPAFLTTARIDDKSCWRWLFEVNRHHFGWLDIDCFVLQPGLFQEMTAMDARHSFNACWSYDITAGVKAFNTFFVFVNADVIKEMRRRGPYVTPVTHAMRPTTKGRHAPGAFSRVLTHKQVRLLREIWPCDADGNIESTPQYFWDTLMVYHLIAKVRGFDLRLVRDLYGTPGHPRSYSTEVIHVGMSGHLSRTNREIVGRPTYTLHLQFRSALLREALDVLPRGYRTLYAEWVQEMQELGVSDDEMGDNIRRYFRSVGVADDVLSGPRWKFLDQRPAWHREGWT